MPSFFQQVVNVLREGGNCQLSGLEGTAKSLVLARLLQSAGSRMVYVTSEIEEGYDVARTLRSIVGVERVRVFSPEELSGGGRGRTVPGEPGTRLHS